MTDQAGWIIYAAYSSGKLEKDFPQGYTQLRYCGTQSIAQ